MPQDDRADGPRSGAKRAAQLLGFVVGLGLFGWAISLALTPDNREQLKRLADAGPTELGALFVLSLVVLAVNGVTFWLVLGPVRRLRLIDTLAVNGLCTFLSYLPFKLGFLLRVAVHNRRDGVPLLVIGAWFAAIMGVFAVAFGGVAVASVLRGGIDWVWGSVAAVATGVLAWLTVAASRALRGPVGVDRLRRVMAALRVPFASRVLGSSAWENVHSAFDMTASWRVVAWGVLLRFVDFGAQSARFLVAAAVLGVPLGWDGALLLTLAYFAIGLISPVGMLGAREGGLIAVAELFGLASDGQTASSYALLALTVTAADLVATIAAAALGAAWLRPDRLFSRLAGAPDADSPLVSSRGEASDESYHRDR